MHLKICVIGKSTRAAYASFSQSHIANMQALTFNKGFISHSRDLFLSNDLAMQSQYFRPIATGVRITNLNYTTVSSNNILGDDVGIT